MLQGALRSGTAGRRVVFELFARSLLGGRRYGVVAGAGRFLDALTDFRFGAGELAWLRDTERGRRRHPRVAGGVPLRRRRLGVPRGRDLLPRIARADGRGDVRRGGAAGDARAERAQPRLGHRVGGLADDPGGGRPAVHRDGLPAHPRAGRRGLRPGRVRRRLRRHVEPAGRPALGAPDQRHQRARVRAGARQRARGVPRTGRGAGRGHRRCWSTRTTCMRRSAPPSRWPVRARGGAHRLRRPGAARRHRCAPSSTSWAPRTPASSSPATSTSTASPGSRHRRSTATAWAPRWSRAPVNRPAASSTSWWRAPATTVRWCRWPRTARLSRPLAAASGRAAGSTPTARPGRARGGRRTAARQPAAAGADGASRQAGVGRAPRCGS